jgi:hypothetical protein
MRLWLRASIRAAAARMTAPRVRAAAGSLVVAAALTATLVAPAAGESVSVSPVRWEASEVPWDAAAVGPRERSLQLVYQTPSCGWRDERMTLRETPQNVIIHMHDEVAVYPPGVALPCPAPRILALKVQLARPLDGRPILGRSRAVLTSPRGVFGYYGSETEPVRVPSLIGFSPFDALHALALGYLRGTLEHVARFGGRARVISQSPGAHLLLARQRLVRVQVSGR